MRNRNSRVKDFFGGVAIVMFIVVLGCIAGYIETHYTREAVVVEINTETNEVVVEDKTNNLWCFIDDENNYKVNDNVKMTMHTNYTDSVITDDVIEKVVKVVKK